MCVACFQAAESQLSRLEAQIAEQREKVAQATPDPATVNKMEAHVKRATKGKYATHPTEIRAGK